MTKKEKMVCNLLIAIAAMAVLLLVRFDMNQVEKTYLEKHPDDSAPCVIETEKEHTPYVTYSYDTVTYFG